MSADDKGFVFWRGPGEDFDIIMEEFVWVLADEVIIDCIVVASCVVIAEISDSLGVLFELACFVT